MRLVVCTTFPSAVRLGGSTVMRSPRAFFLLHSETSLASWIPLIVGFGPAALSEPSAPAKVGSLVLR